MECRVIARRKHQFESVVGLPWTCNGCHVEPRPKGLRRDYMKTVGDSEIKSPRAASADDRSLASICENRAVHPSIFVSRHETEISRQEHASRCRPLRTSAYLRQTY